MLKLRRASALALFVALGLTAASCGSSPGGGASAAASDDAGPDATEAFGPSDAGGIPDAFAACALQTVSPAPLPLDLFFMLDKSGSMNDLVAERTSKWKAVVAAMNAFFADPGSVGIGVGIQYFPLPAAGVPASCTASSQCGSAGPCVLKICNVPKTVTPCDTDADCSGASCIAVGQCAFNPNQLCSLGADCPKDANGFEQGACQAITKSACAKGDSCAEADYAAPAVAIAELAPDGRAASAIAASLAAQTPVNNTPTAAALQGAIDAAAAYARSHPSHSVVAVLATDGQPDECSPSTGDGIAKIAAAALAAQDAVKTIAIGVFAPNAISGGQGTLDAIAKAGGTGSAFIVDASKNVTQEFQAALEKIRGAALPCAYAVPQADGGIADYGLVNVKYTAGGGAATIVPYATTRAQCDAAQGGWYYDVDPAQGATPTKIEMCPATCSTLTGDANGKVDIVLGCQTLAR